MNISYESKNSLSFIGFHTEIAPEDGYRKCPEFWENEYTRKYMRLWQTMQPQTPIEAAILSNGIGMYAICADLDGYSTYWIAGLYQYGEVPEGLELLTFPAGDWAIFSTKGPLPVALQSMNTAIRQEWFPKEGKQYGANDKISIEYYSAGNPQSPDYETGIWIPVAHKP